MKLKDKVVRFSTRYERGKGKVIDTGKATQYGNILIELLEDTRLDKKGNRIIVDQSNIIRVDGRFVSQPIYV